MSPNVFNSKINLPSVVSKLGFSTSDYEFIRMPVFGWFAKSKNSDFIGNIFNFFEPEQWPRLFRIISKDFSDCYDFKLPYSEYAERKLYKEQLTLMEYQSAWLLSKHEARTHRIRHKGDVWYVEDVLKDVGLPALLENEIGYLSDTVIKTFPKLDLTTKQRYQKVMVVPTFCTPKHIASLEVCRIKSMDERELVIENAEKGWYGKHNVEIVKNMDELKIKVGNTWDYKCDYWNTKPIEISDSIETHQLIKIWSEANHTAFTRSPIDLLVGKEGTGDIKHHVALLSHAQIQELEKKTDQKLLDFWVKSKEQQFVVHDNTFIKRGTAYYIIKKNKDEEQISNFCLDIDKIKKKTDADGEETFYWCGNILHNQDVIPFEMSDRYFTSCYLFAKGMRKQFMSLGIGILFINEKYIRQLLSLIQLTCFNVKIEND